MKPIWYDLLDSIVSSIENGGKTKEELVSNFEELVGYAKKSNDKNLLEIVEKMKMAFLRDTDNDIRLSQKLSTLVKLLEESYGITLN